MNKKTIWLLLLLSTITIGTILTYFIGHRIEFKYYPLVFYMVGCGGLTIWLEKHFKARQSQLVEKRLFWPITFLICFMPVFFIASELNYQRNESLMESGAFKIEAMVTDIYQTKGRSTHTWYYEYVYMVDGAEYLDRDMLEYNPVSIGDAVAIYVADEDHSVNRVAKFWEKRSRL